MAGEQAAAGQAVIGVTPGGLGLRRVTAGRGEKSNELRGTRVWSRRCRWRRRSWRLCGSNVDMAVAAAVLVDRSCRKEREREESSSERRNRGERRGFRRRWAARPRPVNRRRLGSVPAATRSSNNEGLKWWVFLPPKLILFSKLIFSTLMLHAKLGFVSFVRNVKK